MRKSKRDVWRDVEELQTDATEIEVISEVVTVTDPEADTVDIPETATVLETSSDVVTVWRE